MIYWLIFFLVLKFILPYLLFINFFGKFDLKVINDFNFKHLIFFLIPSFFILIIYYMIIMYF